MGPGAALLLQEGDGEGAVSFCPRKDTHWKLGGSAQTWRVAASDPCSLPLICELQGSLPFPGGAGFQRRVLEQHTLTGGEHLLQGG